MTSIEIRRKFLEFFKQRGHVIVPSASLVPVNDPSVLFTTAGMQQFKPYYIGQASAQKDFKSLNTVSIQKCVRTSDIDEVGDERHLTFFEMLGNFSFGGYFKSEAINYAYEFVTEVMGLKIDYVSVFGGADGVSADTEVEEIWRAIDPNLKIERFGRADNFWGPTGSEGPCGPTTEIYVAGIEIWNIVFNQYFQHPDQTLKPLAQPGIDTGLGLERLAMVRQGQKNVFETDLLQPIIALIGESSGIRDQKAERIVADHLRTAVFLITDGVVPSNTDQGYILRRLLRRVIHYSDRLNVPANRLADLIDRIADIHGDSDPTIKNDLAKIKAVIKKEEGKFRETLARGLKEFEKGTDPFILLSTYGFPLELTKELAQEIGRKVDEDKFKADLTRHQELSRVGVEQKFKGGLADHSDQVVKYHTATHLLNQALHDVLGDGVEQRGSNITGERLRFDFTSSAKLTDRQKAEVEQIVNEKIAADWPVKFMILPRAEAEKIGARHLVNEKYSETVKVYYIGNSLADAYSKEFCGGPHVERTGQLGRFKIIKEEAIAAGIRRIKAVMV